jgi:hypothetical protein
VGRVNVFISLCWATALLMLRTIDLDNLCICNSNGVKTLSERDVELNELAF